MVDGPEVPAVAIAPEAAGLEVPGPQAESRPLQGVGDVAAPAARRLLGRGALAVAVGVVGDVVGVEALGIEVGT